MTSQNATALAQDNEPVAPRRQRKFLVVVDDTKECRVALRFAAMRARRTRGRLSLVCIVEQHERQNWLGVDDAIRQEKWAEAERILYAMAGEAQDLSTQMPELIIREGKTADMLRKQIEEDPDVSILVLGAATGKEGPGPLVSMIGRGGDKAFPIPVTVVPGNLTDEALEELT